MCGCGCEGCVWVWGVCVGVWGICVGGYVCVGVCVCGCVWGVCVCVCVSLNMIKRNSKVYNYSQYAEVKL